jgi:uncharacterized metal-binding protein (TIGR02443 family)
MTNVEFFKGVECFKCEGKEFTRLWKYDRYSWMCECVECGFRFRRSYREVEQGITDERTYKVYSPIRKRHCSASGVSRNRFFKSVSKRKDRQMGNHC